MGSHTTFIIVIIVLVAAYQVAWIVMAYVESWKLGKVRENGSVYSGVISKVKKDFWKFSSTTEIYVMIDCEDGTRKELRNWPRAKRSPFPAGTPIDVYFSKDYPTECIFADEKIASMRFISPMGEDGKLSARFIIVRSILIWIITAAVIAFVIYIQK